jgi:tetratricopeptide (TPR) repeat protein
MLVTILRSYRAAIWITITAISVVGCQCTFPALADDAAPGNGTSESAQSEAAPEQLTKSGQSEEAPDQLKKLSFAEQLYFGRASNDPNADGRLARLEKALYGHSKSGSFEKRFDRIDDALGVEARMRKARPASSESSATSAEPPLKVSDRASQSLRTKQSASSIGNKEIEAASPKTDSDTRALSPALVDKVQEPEVVNTAATTASKPLTPKMADTLDPKSTSKSLDPKSTSKTLDPKLTSKPLDLTSTSKTPDPQSTGKTLNPKLTGKPLDPKVANKASAPKLAKPLEPKLDSKALDSKLTTKPPNASGSGTASSLPSPAQLLLKQGMAAHKAGNHQVAEDKFRRVLTMEPRNADAFFNLGALAETRGDLIGALTHYRAALGINPLDRQLQDAVRSVEDQVANQNGTASSIAPKSHSASPLAYTRPPVYDVSQQAAPEYDVAQYPPPASTNPNAFSLQTATYGANLQNQPPIYGVSQQPPPIYGVSQQPPPIYNVSQFPPPVLPVSGVPHCPVCHVTHNQPPTHGLINAFLSAGGGAALGPLHCPICRLSHMGW